MNTEETGSCFSGRRVCAEQWGQGNVLQSFVLFVEDTECYEVYDVLDLEDKI